MEPAGSLRRSSTDGITGQWWYLDSQQVRPCELPSGASLFQSTSMYYCDGHGFWVLQGDATSTSPYPWRPLTFEHDRTNYSSYLTHYGSHPTLLYLRENQYWPHMLLPDIYLITPGPPHLSYGGLKGDTGIFLALIAFSMRSERLRQFMSSMFRNGQWQAHGLPHGRKIDPALKLFQDTDFSLRLAQAWCSCLYLYCSRTHV